MRSIETMKKSEHKPDPSLLNEYAAAALVGMSPELLRWFTSYAPVCNDGED